MWRSSKGKIKMPLLVMMLFVLLVDCIIVNNFGIKIVHFSNYDLQVEAAKLMQKSMDAIRDKKLELGIDINFEKDPNATGLIGVKNSEITTSPGIEESKRTATSPSFAALMIKYFTKIGLKTGDVVAIGASGSFPGLILATLCACQVMNIEPILIYSIGSSQYGANVPEYTFVEMLKHLNKEKIISKYIDAISMGGKNDIAEDPLTDEGREIILNIIKSSGVSIFIYEDELKDSIDKRIEFYLSNSMKKTIKCFINLGANPANMGNVSSVQSFFNGNNGLIFKVPTFLPNKENGVEYEFSQLGMPIIHIIETRYLAFKSNMEVDPYPFSEIGEEGIYYTIKYNKVLIASLILLQTFILFLFLRKCKQVPLNN